MDREPPRQRVLRCSDLVFSICSKACPLRICIIIACFQQGMPKHQWKTSCDCSGKEKAFPEALITMTAKLLVRGMTFQSQNVGGVKQALAIPLTETQALAWALPFLLVPGKGSKVERPCCIPLKSNFITIYSLSCTCNRGKLQLFENFIVRRIFCPCLNC